MDTRDEFAAADRLHDEGRFAEAFELFLRLAKAGDMASMSRVALMFYNGEGVARDVDQSISWDRKAADLGDFVACSNLGLTYKDLGDTQAALHWLEKSFQQGNGEAAFEMAKIHMETGSDVREIKRCLEAVLRSIYVFEDTKLQALQLLTK